MSQELRLTSPTEVPPSSIAFITSAGDEIHDDKMTIVEANINDGDTIKYKILKVCVTDDRCDRAVHNEIFQVCVCVRVRVRV